MKRERSVIRTDQNRWFFSIRNAKLTAGRWNLSRSSDYSSFINEAFRIIIIMIVGAILIVPSPFSFLPERSSTRAEAEQISQTLNQQDSVIRQNAPNPKSFLHGGRIYGTGNESA